MLVKLVTIESTDDDVGPGDEISSDLANINADVDVAAKEATVEDDRAGNDSCESLCLLIEEVRKQSHSKVSNAIYYRSEHEITNVGERVIPRASEKEMAIEQKVQNYSPDIVVV